MLSPASIDSQSTAATTHIRTVGLRKRYGSIVALDGVDLTIERGELFGLLGPNGAGKTTLLSILSGLLEPDDGRVWLGDERIRPERPIVRRRLGLAPQDIALYPDLSARENLAFFGQLYGLVGSELQQRVDRTLNAVQLQDRADDRAGTFSGGMKRRLNLALAVLHRPEVLFLDEPTTGVDPQSRNHIFEEVRRLNSEGMTVVYCSHYMEEVQALCRRVGIIDHGKLVRCAPISQLLELDDSVIRFRLHHGEAPVSRIQNLDSVRQAEQSGTIVEIRTANAGATWPPLMQLLSESSLKPLDLEIARPTLEHVFLRLTGHALRD